MGTYSIINDSLGNMCGIWLQDSNQANNKQFIAMLLIKENSDENMRLEALLGNYRIVPNSYDDKGGAFIMFNSQLAPGEAQEQNKEMNDY